MKDKNFLDIYKEKLIEIRKKQFKVVEFKRGFSIKNRVKKGKAPKSRKPIAPPSILLKKPILLPPISLHLLRQFTLKKGFKLSCSYSNSTFQSNNPVD